MIFSDMRYEQDYAKPKSHTKAFTCRINLPICLTRSMSLRSSALTSSLCVVIIPVKHFFTASSCRGISWVLLADISITALWLPTTALNSSISVWIKQVNFTCLHVVCWVILPFNCIWTKPKPELSDRQKLSGIQGEVLGHNFGFPMFYTFKLVTQLKIESWTGLFVSNHLWGWALIYWFVRNK